jgi:hypothetical protein
MVVARREWQIDCDGINGSETACHRRSVAGKSQSPPDEEMLVAECRMRNAARTSAAKPRKRFFAAWGRQDREVNGLGSSKNSNGW